MKEVYVVHCTPWAYNNLRPYVYGVFDTYDQADEHFKKHGDKESDRTIEKTHYLPLR